MISAQRKILFIHFAGLIGLWLFIISCGQKIKEKKQAIVGQWQLLEIRAVNGKIEKAPGLTLYTFKPDDTYKFELDKNDSLVFSYSGVYNVNDKEDVLATDYTIDGENTKENAAILSLTSRELIIKDMSNTGDTILFRKYIPLTK